MIPAIIGATVVGLPCFLVMGRRQNRSYSYILLMWALMLVLVAVVTKFLFGTY